MFEIIELLRQFVFLVGYIAPSNSFPDPLTAQEEKEAIKGLLSGNAEAKDKLIRHNLRLVAHVAKKYVGSYFDQDDLISIGTIGLIKAVSTFDAHKGANLATYAARCIQNEILMALRSAKKYRSDVSLGDSIGTDKEGNEITIADVIGTPGDAIPDEVALLIESEKLRRCIHEVLTPRERLVIELRYGLNGYCCLPQREVAQMLDISRSYVSRIEKKSLEKLYKAFEAAH